MHKIICIYLFLLITACTSTTERQAINNSNHQGKAKLIFEQTSAFNVLTNGYRGYFISVRNSKGESIADDNSLVNKIQHKELYLKPGAYKIVARCEATSNLSYPFADITVTENDLLLFACEKLETKNSHVTLTIKNLNENSGSAYKITSQRRHVKLTKLPGYKNLKK